MVGRGGRLKREGLCVYTWLIHIVVNQQQKLTQHCKAITLQCFKKIKRNVYKSTVWSWSAGGASSY